MNNTNTGGPAFPGKQKALMIQSEHIGIASEYEIEHNGMTLRDFFAAKAMQSYLSDLCFSIDDDRDIYFKEAAEISYQVADAMLKAREQ